MIIPALVLFGDSLTGHANHPFAGEEIHRIGGVLIHDVAVSSWLKEIEELGKIGRAKAGHSTSTSEEVILAISKDKKQLLVVELKKGRASDTVVGQTLRYMSFVQEQLAENGQTVKGIIIAHEDDQRIRRALMMTANITFYRYQVTFKLLKA